jgi:hypothetical protein
VVVSFDQDGSDVDDHSEEGAAPPGDCDSGNTSDTDDSDSALKILERTVVLPPATMGPPPESGDDVPPVCPSTDVPAPGGAQLGAEGGLPPGSSSDIPDDPPSLPPPPMPPPPDPPSSAPGTPQQRGRAHAVYRVPGCGRLAKVSAYNYKSKSFEAVCGNPAHGLCRRTKTGRPPNARSMFANRGQGRCAAALVAWVEFGSTNPAASKLDHALYEPSLEDRRAVRARLKTVGDSYRALLAHERPNNILVEESELDFIA